MRLRIVERGHRLKQRLILTLFPLLVRTKPTDFTRILLYRPELFGKPFGRYSQVALRGASSWSIGERELFGAYRSARNDCEFCTDLHCSIASRALGRDDVPALLTAASTADLRPQVAAMLGFLGTLQADPASLSVADLKPLRAVGLSDRAILEATHAATVLAIANRVVNALDARVATPAQRDRIATLLLNRGYDL
jgi:uncharacterized peroxidase-related enzyme